MLQRPREYFAKDPDSIFKRHDPTYGTAEGFGKEDPYLPGDYRSLFNLVKEGISHENCKVLIVVKDTG